MLGSPCRDCVLGARHMIQIVFWNVGALQVHRFQHSNTWLFPILPSQNGEDQECLLWPEK